MSQGYAGCSSGCGFSSPRNYVASASAGSQLESIAHNSVSYCATDSGSLSDTFAYAVNDANHSHGVGDAGSYGVNNFSNTGSTYGNVVMSIINSLVYNHEKNNFHNQTTYQSNHLTYDLFKTEQNYNFIPDNFLQPGKTGRFVGKAEEIKEFIEETFEKMFAERFPENIKISVLDNEKFRKLAPSPATIGLSINRGKQGLLSEIFVLNDTLGRVMLTIGHELGHVLSETLGNAHDEEAKAYAFSLAWMKTIKENNIAGLGNALILENPAHNGLHNVAFNFVHQLIRQGKDFWGVYRGLVKGMVRVGS